MFCKNQSRTLSVPAGSDIGMGTESDDFSAAGLPGLALQWALIPLAAYWTESLIAKRNH